MAIVQIPPAAVAAAGAVRPRPQHRVSVRKTWAGAWAAAPYLEAVEVVRAAAPTVDSATLRYRAGSIKREDAAAFSPQDLPDYAGWYVRVELASAGAQPFPLFVGRVAEHDERRLGTAAGRTRDHDLTAYGLADDLDRAHVAGCWVTNDNEAGLGIARPLPFNDRYVHGFREVGNRSANPVTSRGGKPAYAFAGFRDAQGRGGVWTARQIVEYLLVNYAPAGVPWSLRGQPEALDVVEPPRLETAGLSVWQLVNELVDRRRGLGFRVDCDGEKAFLDVFTTVGAPVTIDRQTLPANPRKQPVDLDALGHAADVAAVRVDTCKSYDRVRVEAGPVVACFTVSFEDETLVAGWTEAKEAAYKAGLPAGSGERNDAERGTEKFDHVFAKFLIPERAWGWTAGDGQTKKTGQPRRPVHLTPDRDGRLEPAISVPAPIKTYRTWGHTLLRELPLLKDQRTVADPWNSDPEFREMLVLVRDESKPGQERYRYVDSSTVADDVAGDVRPLDREMGFLVKMRPAHLLAKNHWAGHAPSETEPKYDWQKMIATVACRTDAWLSVRADVRPAAAGAAPDAAPDRVLVIEVPDAESWVILEGTVLDLDKDRGSLKRQPKTQVLRDDSPRLRQVAAFALAWCREDHAALTLPVKDAWLATPVGTFVTTVRDGGGERKVNSVVSQVAYDLAAMTTVVQTNYGELDFAGAAGRRGATVLR